MADTDGATDQQSIPTQIQQIIEDSAHDQLSLREMMARSGHSSAEIVSAAEESDHLDLDSSRGVISLADESPRTDGGEDVGLIGSTAGSKMSGDISAIIDQDDVRIILDADDVEMHVRRGETIQIEAHLPDEDRTVEIALEGDRELMEWLGETLLEAATVMTDGGRSIEDDTDQRCKCCGKIIKSRHGTDVHNTCEDCAIADCAWWDDDAECRASGQSTLLPDSKTTDLLDGVSCANCEDPVGPEIAIRSGKQLYCSQQCHDDDVCCDQSGEEVSHA